MSDASGTREEEFTKTLDTILSDWTTLADLTTRVRNIIFHISLSNLFTNLEETLRFVFFFQISLSLSLSLDNDDDGVCI